jgi:hypothetical protein
MSVDGFPLWSEFLALRDRHPLKVIRGATHTPANLRAAELADGAGLTDAHRKATVDELVAQGAWCVGEDSDNDAFSYAGFIMSGAEAAQNVICPIMRDNTDTTTGLSALWAEIYWAPPPPENSGMSCTYYAKNISNTVIDTGLDSTAYHGECSAGAECVLSWDTADYDESADPGYSYLACYLNAGSGAIINSYKAREN